MRSLTFAAAVFLAAPSLAQAPGIQDHAIHVSGHGRVSEPPDTARIQYWVRGEGKTPDEASRAMAALQAQVENGLRSLLGPDAKISNSNLLVIEVRDSKCTEQNRPQLSEGNCAVIGYLARSEGEVETSNLMKAGTAVGLASRLGASDARLEGFELRDTTAARKTAMTKAVADAREQALTLAAAAGGHLGRVLNMQYGSYFAVIDSIVAPPAPPPPPPPPPPVQIDVNPRPQEISADVSVSYELLP